MIFLISCVNQTDEPTPKPEYHSADNLTALNKNIEKYPDSFLLKENLLQYYRDSGLYEKAIASAISFLLKDSLNPRLHHMLGYLYFENGDTSNAINSFGEAYFIAPNPEDLILMSQLSAMKGMTMAKNVADTLIQSNDQLFKKQGNFIAGIYCKSNKEYEKALTYFDACLAIDYTFMEAYVEKTNTLLLMGQTKAAAETIQKAVTLQNNFTAGYLLLAKCQEMLHHPEKAAEAYRRVLLYEPDAEEAQEGLNRCESNH